MSVHKRQSIYSDSTKSWLFFASWMYICMGSVLGSSVQGHSSRCTHLCDNICWIPRCRPCHTNLCVCAHWKVREPKRVWACVWACVRVCVFHVLTRYFSRGSVSNASPNIDRQYSAILACCFGLGVVAHTKKTNTDTHIVKRSLCHRSNTEYVCFIF